MKVIHFVPAQPNEFAYFFIKQSDDHEILLERHPLIGFATKTYEVGSGELVIETYPVSSIGDNATPHFIQRYDGTFTDAKGEHASYSITEFMQKWGYEPDNLTDLPPQNPKELREYVWRPLRNPQD